MTIDDARVVDDFMQVPRYILPVFQRVILSRIPDGMAALLAGMFVPLAV